jgi:LDH2 family malate/lactate/ureidoglycolate dehydrogenase
VGKTVDESVTISAAEATALAVSVLRRQGFTHEEAAVIAAQLVDAELVGTHIMGLIRLKLIGDLVARHERRPITLAVDRPVHALVDGGMNPGYLSVDFATGIAIEKAASSSLAFVGIKNSSLAGMAGYYVDKVARAGLVGAMFISSYARVAPHGGVDPVLGTNPIAFGVPTPGDPVVVDVSTSVISNGQVEMAKAVGDLLPEGCAVDADGRPTRDPVEAQRGALLPASAHKGFGLALAVQLLGILTGGDPVPVGLGNQGIALLVLDPDMFGSAGSFHAGTGDLLDRLKSSRSASEDDPLRYPGEGRAHRRRESLESGISVPRSVLDLIQSL